MSKNKNNDKPQKTAAPASGPVIEPRGGEPAPQPVAAPAGTSVVGDYGEDAGVGTEQMVGLQRAPILKLLQANNPEVQPGAKNVPGARAGMFLNPTSGALIEGDKGFTFVPAAYRRMCVEYRARSAGGGFVSAQPWSKELMREGKAGKNDQGRVKLGTRILPNSIERVDTHYLVGFLTDDPKEGTPSDLIVLSMTSSKIGPLTQWFNRFFQMKSAAGKSPPLFAGIVQVTAKWEPKNQGYFNISIVPAIEDDYAKSLLRKGMAGYDAGKQLHEMMERREVDILYETAPDEDEEVGDVPAAQQTEGKRPF